MGKPHGNDLRNGNYTLPVIYALEERPELAELLQEEAPVELVIGPICDSRAIRRASTEARRWIEKAKDAVHWLAAARGLLEIADAEFGALDDCGYDTAPPVLDEADIVCRRWRPRRSDRCVYAGV